LIGVVSYWFFLLFRERRDRWILLSLFPTSPDATANKYGEGCTKTADETSSNRVGTLKAHETERDGERYHTQQ
jgi:hypothetical protein